MHLSDTEHGVSKLLNSTLEYDVRNKNTSMWCMLQVRIKETCH